MTTFTTGRGIVVPATTIRFESGATRLVPTSMLDDTSPHGGERPTLLGLSDEGRIVMHYYPDSDDGGHTFGLTTCCLASDKGTEDGVVCRGCYGAKPDADIGRYDDTAVDPYVGPVEDSAGGAA